MSQSANIDPEKIKLFHIDIVESAIKDLPRKGNNDFDINVAHLIMHNLEEKRVKIEMYLNLQHQEASVDASAKFQFDFHFHIENLQEFYSLNEEKLPVFFSDFIATLLGISFSTIRGIVYERLSSTNMNGLVLPVVSPRKMLSSKKEE